MIFDKQNGIKVVGLDMTSIYWDSDMEQVITKNKISVKDKKQLEKVNHMPPELYLYLKVYESLNMISCIRTLKLSKHPYILLTSVTFL